MKHNGKRLFFSSVAIAALTCGASAEERAGVYSLGEIYVSGATKDTGAAGIGGSTVTRAETWSFGKQTLDQAVNIVPGVSSSMESNGRRNESDIFVRGFGRWQVPLMIDGVRVYLPADNRLDFNRFLTNDIAEIQIQKGYASVLDGPGAMGGAINLVTRKPTKPFEGEFQGGFTLDNTGRFQGWEGYAMAGSRQKDFYLMGSATYQNQDFWSLSRDYQPAPGSLQGTGERISSDTRDWRVNLKAGFTPNETDEYSINFIKQSGEKGAPLNVYNNPPIPGNGYWRWPTWNIQNLSFLSHTQIGDASYVKTKLFYNTFDNVLSAYDNITYTTQSNNGRFNSIYEDYAYGGSVEAGTELIPMNTLKGAFHYRQDHHAEWNHNRPTHPSLSNTEPKQHQAQTTWSIAAENTFHATPDLDLVAGISYDKYRIDKAEEFNSGTGLIYEYPKGGSGAFNWQAAAIWRYSDMAQLYASVSDRSRFPVIFELYSTRFGNAVPNPDLGPERATNYEIGWKGQVASNLRGTAAVFYSDVRDLIQTVNVGGGQTQTQNVGNGKFYGFEVSGEWQIAAQLKVGGNYTYMYRTITDALLPELRPTGVPMHKTFLYASWQPIERLTITPSLEIASSRWSDRNAAVVNPLYVQTGAYTLANVQADYQFTDNFQVAVGVKNILDQNYELAWGLPSPGRTVYAKAKATF